MNKFKDGDKVKLNPNMNYASIGLNRGRQSFNKVYTIEKEGIPPSPSYWLYETDNIYPENYLRRVK